MAHNGDSRSITAGVRIDKDLKKELEEFEKDWGIPQCTLSSVCLYIGIAKVKQRKIKIMNTKLTLPEVMKLDSEADSWFRPFQDLFCNKDIPIKLSSDIIASLNLKVREIEENMEVEE